MNSTGSILITYYSRSGNTLKIAELIKLEIGGTLHEIHPQKPYPPDNNVIVEQAKQEIRTGYKPPLKSMIETIDLYDVIYIGSPIWWGTMAPPMASFLSKNTFSDKTILPFCTHGGGGSGTFENDIARLCPHAKVISGFSINKRDIEKAQSEIITWLGGAELS